jgi:hypothetical protein
MKFWCWVLLATFVAVSGCQAFASFVGSSQALSPARRAAVESEVRQFTATVAHDVTSDGPIAWRKFFADQPEFFMAVNGKLIFPDGQSAANALPQIASQFKHIELQWGADLRLDPLTDKLCSVATSYTENIELQPGVTGMPSGREVGYFTGIAESRDGHWQFRNAHWSQPLPASKTP